VGRPWRTSRVRELLQGLRSMSQTAASVASVTCSRGEIRKKGERSFTDVGKGGFRCSPVLHKCRESQSAAARRRWGRKRGLRREILISSGKKAVKHELWPGFCGIKRCWRSMFSVFQPPTSHEEGF